MSIRNATSLVLAVAASLLISSSALAYADVDHVRLGGLGKGQVAYGRPNALPGSILWQVLTPGPPKVYRAQVVGGGLSATGPNTATLCARLKVVFFRANGTRLATRFSAPTQMVCLPPNTGGNGNGGTNVWFDSSAVRIVRVILQKAPAATGPWTNVAALSCKLGTTDCP